MLHSRDKDKVRLTIIITAYNVEAYIEKCINSVIRQSLKCIEIIIVDDGSTDSSGEICDKLAGIDSRIKIIHQDNEGLIRARMHGVREATCPFVTFVDGDDWIEKDYYNNLACEMNEEDDICIGTYKVEYLDRVEVPYRITLTERLDRRSAVLRMFRKEGYDWSGVGKIYRRTLFDTIGEWWTYNPYGEDTELNWKLFSTAQKFRYVPANGYHYVQHESSMMHNLSVSVLAYYDRLNIIMDSINKRDVELYRDIGRVRLDAARYQLEQITSNEQYIQSDELRAKLSMVFRDAKREQGTVEDTFTGKSDLEMELFPFSKEVLEFCKKYTSIYVYGTGKYAEIAENYLNHIDSESNGFIVSKGHKKTDYYKGKTVMEVDDISIDRDTGIVVTAEKKDSIVKNLFNRGVDENQIYVWRCRWNYDCIVDDNKVDTKKREVENSVRCRIERFVRDNDNIIFTSEMEGVYDASFCTESKETFVKDVFANMTDNPMYIIGDLFFRNSHQIMAIVNAIDIMQDGAVYVVCNLWTSDTCCGGSYYQDTCVSTRSFCEMICHLKGNERYTALEKRADEPWDLARMVANKIAHIEYTGDVCMLRKGK